MNIPAALMAIGAICLWSTNATVAKHALADMTVAQVQTLQFAGAAVAFLILRCLSRSATARPSIAAVSLGVIGLVGTMVLQYLAFSYGPITTTNLIAYAWPLLTAVFIAVVIGTNNPVKMVLGSLAGFVGVGLLMTGQGTEGSITGFSWAGYAAAIASAICMATYTIGIARVSDSPASVLLPASIIGLAGAALWWLASGAGGITPQQALIGLYLGAGPMGLGYALWSYAMRGSNAGNLSTLGYITPVSSTCLLILSGEHLTQSAVIGGAVVIVSCLVVSTKDEPTNEPKPA